MVYISIVKIINLHGLLFSASQTSASKLEKKVTIQNTGMTGSVHVQGF